MNNIRITRSKGLRGTIIPPPDKSISHRAMIFASVASGKSRIVNYLRAEDTLSTMKAMKAFGVEITDSGKELTVIGTGLRGLKEPEDVIDCGNSGTTARLLSGLIAGNDHFVVLTGDSSLRQRPMSRVIKPLSFMGARIVARKDNSLLPMTIKGGGLRGIDYSMPVSSAQVKSCLILAGLYADGATVITEPIRSRDHTERMLSSMGVKLELSNRRVTVYPPTEPLMPLDLHVPGDFSSAAFFIVAALLVPNSELVIEGVLINPTRSGLLRVLNHMGASVEIVDKKVVSGEEVATLVCRGAQTLKATKVGADLMPSMIDEFPILCIASALAEGTTEIRGAEELRVKESDRISAMATGLRQMGVEIVEHPDGLDICGCKKLKGARVNSFGDHRIAMSFAIAGLLAEGDTLIENADCVSISYPEFFETLKACQRS